MTDDTPEAIADRYRKQGDHNLAVHAAARRLLCFECDHRFKAEPNTICPLCGGPSEPRRGRPPLAAESKRSVLVKVRLTPGEVEAIDAARGNVSRAAWFRRVLAEA